MEANSDIQSGSAKVLVLVPARKAAKRGLRAAGSNPWADEAHELKTLFARRTQRVLRRIERGGLSITELAERLGVKPATLRGVIKNPWPEQTRLKRGVADALRTTVDLLWPSPRREMDKIQRRHGRLREAALVRAHDEENARWRQRIKTSSRAALEQVENEIIFSESNVSQMFGISSALLVDWREKRMGPNYIEHSDGTFYSERAINLWCEARSSEKKSKLNNQVASFGPGPDLHLVKQLARIIKDARRRTGAEKLLDEDEVADFFNLAPWVVSEWRRAGTGPAFIVMPDDIIRYRDRDLSRWFKSREEERKARVYGVQSSSSAEVACDGA
jgi:lambda repressor-like predicted transcriptional regulator